jgi:hypothetical protein
MTDLNESIARIEKCFWLPGIIYNDPSDEFCEFFDECEDVDGLPEIANAHSLVDDDGFSERDAAEDALGQMAHRKRDGFLFQVAVPVTSHHRPGSYQFSWGHYICKWMYARTVAEMAAKARAFADERLALDGKPATPSVSVIAREEDKAEKVE